MGFRIIVLTNGSPHGFHILDALADYDIRVDAVVYETRPSLRDNVTSSGSLPRKLLGLAKSGPKWVRSLARMRSAPRRYAALASEVVLTGPANSDKMQRDLGDLRPDFILLGGIGILNADILRTARHGVINVHPGLLPWLRGTGVVGRAIEQGIPVGCTTHYVTAIVDAGAIIERRFLAVTGRERDLGDLETAAAMLAAQMMSDLVVEHLDQGAIPQAVPQTKRYPLYRPLSAAGRATVSKQIKQGQAKDLFERWRPCCLDPVRCVLPAAFTAFDDLTPR